MTRETGGARPSRRERPAKPALTRDGIVAAALGILREEGLGKVTMRRVAQELDTGHASLYVYVRDTGDLHAQVLDALLAPVLESAAEITAGAWRDRLKALLNRYLDVVAAHPEIARMAISTRPNGPHYAALLERVAALLAAGGIGGGRAAWALDLLLLYPTALAAEHPGPGRESARGAADASLAWLRHPDPGDHPHLAALGGELLSGTPAQRVDWALDVLLNGIAATPPASRPRAEED